MLLFLNIYVDFLRRASDKKRKKDCYNKCIHNPKNLEV